MRGKPYALLCVLCRLPHILACGSLSCASVHYSLNRPCRATKQGERNAHRQLRCFIVVWCRHDVTPLACADSLPRQFGIASIGCGGCGPDANLQWPKRHTRTPVAQARTAQCGRKGGERSTKATAFDRPRIKLSARSVRVCSGAMYGLCMAWHSHT